MGVVSTWSIDRSYDLLLLLRTGIIVLIDSSDWW